LCFYREYYYFRSTRHPARPHAMSVDSLCGSAGDAERVETTPTPVLSDEIKQDCPPPAMFGPGSSGRIHWKRQNDSIRLIHIITSTQMRDKFVNVDQKQSREQLDSGKVDKKVFWEEVVAMFNNTTIAFNPLFEGDMHVKSAGLNPNLMYKEADVGEAGFLLHQYRYSYTAIVAEY